MEARHAVAIAGMNLILISGAFTQKQQVTQNLKGEIGRNSKL